MKISNELANWDDEDSNNEDMYYDHFEKSNLWDWCDIANEGRSVWNQMFQGDLEADSPIDCIFSAIAAQAAHGAFAAIAEMFGVKCDDIESIVAYWYENQNNTPPALKIGNKFNKYIKEVKTYENIAEEQHAELPIFLKPKEKPNNG